MNREHDDREDERWLRSLVTALRDPSESAGSLAFAAPPSRPAWFHVITVCGLVVLLLPVNSSRLREWAAPDRQAESNAPSVHGWSEHRPQQTASLDTRDGAGYSAALNQPASASVPGLNAGRAVGTAWAPVRVGFGVDMASSMPRVARFVIRNVPASATLSRGRRMPDGTWVIDTPGLEEVVIALADEPSRDLSIEIEGHGSDGDVVAHEHVRAGHAPSAFTEAKPSPRMKSANAAPASPPQPEAPAVIVENAVPALIPATADSSRRFRVAENRPPVVKARARSGVSADPVLERGPVIRSSSSNMRWNRFAFDRD